MILRKRTNPDFMNFAVVYMSVKIGLILLATFTSMALLIGYVSQQLALEMTKTKSLLLASPFNGDHYVKVVFHLQDADDIRKI